MELTCQNCGQTFSAVEGAEIRTVRSKVFETGTCCPHCKTWTHAYFATPELDRAQRLLQAWLGRYNEHKTDHNFQHLQFQQAAYRRLFNQIQRRERRKKGMPGWESFLV